MAWILMLLGLLLLVVAALVARSQLAKLKSWPRLSVQVASVEIVPYGGTDNDEAKDSYGLRIKVRYEKGGSQVEKTIEPKTSDSSYADVAQLAEKLREPGVHEAIQNPDNADELFFDPGWNWDLLIIPAVIAAFGAVIALFGLILVLSTLSLASDPVRLIAPISLAVALILVCAAIGSIGYHVRHLSWPKVDARIDKVDWVVRLAQITQGEDPTSMTRYNFAPRAWISYDFGGKSYHSVWVSPVFRSGSGTHEWLKGEVEKLRQAGKLEVYLRPDNPYEATQPRIRLLVVLIPLGISVLFFGLYFLTRKR